MKEINQKTMIKIVTCETISTETIYPCANGVPSSEAAAHILELKHLGIEFKTFIITESEIEFD